MSAALDLPFGDGVYRFDLSKIGELRELQVKCGTGPHKIAGRLLSDEWLVDDIRETLRIGLMGGGMKSTDALRLVDRYAGEGGWLTHLPTAQAVILAALKWPEDIERPKGGPPTETTAAAAPLTSSTLEASTGSALHSA